MPTPSAAPTSYPKTPSPTPNFWASDKGETIAVSSALSSMFVVMVAFAYFGYRHTQKQNEELKQQNRSPSLNVSLLGSDNPSSKRSFPKKGNVSLFYSKTTFLPMVLLYWALMLCHTAFVMTGLVAFWDNTSLKGTSVEVVDHDDLADDVLIDKFKIDIYDSTFWTNIQEFWNSHAKPMACLIYFAGVIQPCLQMIAVLVIAYAPISTLHRHRMITIQEMTCKIPLSSFYVEAFLLITFSFSVNYTTREVDVNPLNPPKYFVNEGHVVITGFIGLCFFLSGQVMFLPIVNMLRLEHRRQCYEKVKQEEEEADYDTYVSNHNNSIIRPHLVIEDFVASHNTSGGGGVAATSTAVMNEREEDESGENSSYDPNHVIIGPLVERSKKLRIATILVGIALILVTYYILFYPFILLEYRGVAASFITEVRGSETIHGVNNTKLDLPVNLYEGTWWLKDDLVPYKYAIYYAILAITILVINPLLCCGLIMINALIPDRFTAQRRYIGEQVELLQCWCGAEAMVVASVFTVWNMELITKFVFDDSDICKNVDKKVGEECLVVKCTFISWYATACMLLYAILIVILVRISAYELHGGFNAWNNKHVKVISNNLDEYGNVVTSSYKQTKNPTYA